MNRSNRLLIALCLFLSGLVLVPQVDLVAGAITWQRFANGYEDQVIVTRARCENDDFELEVRALTTAGSNATLSVYRAGDGAFIGTLTYQGGNEHRGEFNVFPCPQAITVLSTLGGQATVIVLPGSGIPPTVTPSATAVPTATATATATPPPIALPSYAWRLQTGALDTGTWSLFSDGTFQDDMGRTGRWGYQAASNRFLLRYDDGQACGAFLLGGFTTSTTLRGQSLCTDGSGLRGFWQAAIATSQDLGPAGGDRGQPGLAVPPALDNE